jgi:hypothetical protein
MDRGRCGALWRPRPVQQRRATTRSRPCYLTNEEQQELNSNIGRCLGSQGSCTRQCCVATGVQTSVSRGEQGVPGRGAAAPRHLRKA